MDELIKYFPDLSHLQIRQFKLMGELYVEWNSKINVVSRKDIDQIYTHHILHSMAIAKTNLIVPGQTVMDVGCGGGLPVIPLAVLMPNVEFTALDSIGKKILVVNQITKALGLTNVKAVNARVESLDERFDWVISRAVTDLKTFVGWTWNKTTMGIIYLKGGDLSQEIRSANRHVEEYSIADYFNNPYFETKKILYLPKK